MLKQLTRIICLLTILLSFSTASMYIDEEVNRQAKQKLDDIFGEGTSDNL